MKIENFVAVKNVLLFLVHIIHVLNNEHKLYVYVTFIDLNTTMC